MVNMNFKISRGFEKNVSIVCSCDNEDFAKHRWTRNPAIRVQFPVGPMFCTLLNAEGETSSRLLCETIEAEISEAGEEDQRNEIRPCYFASVL